MLYIAIACFLIGGLYFFLRQRGTKFEGEDLTPYDSVPEVFASASPSKGMDALYAYLEEAFGASGAKPSRATSGWEQKREQFEAAGLARSYDGVEFRPDVIAVNGREMPGAWTLLPNSDPNRRLLYMHGGAFAVGSDISHRPLTVQLARRTGMAVFTPNYRLMPENSRQDIIDDAREAYRWILENGPDGKAPLSKLVLAGDSAGGNLALMLANWARNHAQRQPDAVVALSPTTDATLSSPSMKANLSTDPMLSPLLGAVLKAPRMLLLPALAKHYGMAPAHPDQSPIFDELSNLPPTFIQASNSEMLYDDSVRFAAKAKAAESPVFFQSWGGGLPHVWQIFDEYIPESHAALKEIEVFLAKYV